MLIKVGNNTPGYMNLEMSMNYNHPDYSHVGMAKKEKKNNKRLLDSVHRAPLVLR